MSKIYLITSVFIVFLILSFGINQFLVLKRAHSNFENYYTFRGCVQLLEKKADYGVCKTGSGETIKIVKYNNKWYLDGDLPWACLGGICFGL